MSDFDEDDFEETTEQGAEGEPTPHPYAKSKAVLVPGQLARFLNTMTEQQRELWTPIRNAWKQEVKDAQKVSGQSEKSNRDTLYDAMNRAQGKITAAEIEDGIRAGLKKGDPQAVRVMAQMAGIDLSDRPQTAAGEGAKVIIIRPHPLLLSQEDEDDIQRQIAEH